MRGRRPKPTAVKEASGSYKSNPQRRNPGEPKPQLGWPEAPEQIESDAVAKTEWEAICHELDSMQLLAKTDRALIALYCTTHAMWLDKYLHIKEHGGTQFSDKGLGSQTPEALQEQRYADRKIKLLGELGLTPSQRSRMSVVKKEEDNPFTAYMKKRMQAFDN